MTFKVGDKVRVSDHYSYLYGHGQDGVIVPMASDWNWCDYTVAFSSDDKCGYNTEELELVTEATSEASTTTEAEISEAMAIIDQTFYSQYTTDGQLSDGGPSRYYDWEPGWTTLNDFIEHKSLHQWKEHSFHWGNVVKALTRWGDKDGTSCEYDAKKVIYSGCRVLKAIIGVDGLRSYLQKLLDDPQFKSKDN